MAALWLIFLDVDFTDVDFTDVDFTDIVAHKILPKTAYYMPNFYQGEFIGNKNYFSLIILALLFQPHYFSIA